MFDPQIINKREKWRRYWKKWYMENKDEINKRRRKEYKNNHGENLAKIQTYVNKNRISYWITNTISDHKKKKYIIDFSRGDLKLLAEKTNHCFYCNIKLNFDGRQGRGPKNNSPTLDRINNQKRLNTNGIRIICYRCNKSKSNRTHKEFVSYCNMIANKF